MNRITDQVLDARVDTINRLLGLEPASVTWKTDGAVTLDKAYGGVRVARYSGTSGGIVGLTDGHGTKREAFLFLGGMIEGLRMAKGNR